MLLLAISCGNNGGGKSSAVAEQKATFAPPMVPMQIVDGQDKLSYMVEHFWDGYNFADTQLLNDKEVTGQAFATYAQLLMQSPYIQVEQSVNRVLSKSLQGDSLAFVRFTSLFEDYFYNANSPFMNEELYIPALKFIVGSDAVSEIDKLRPQMQLEMALKNRVGQRAADFEYTLKNGRKSHLHNIVAQFTILYFNNPDCHDCARVKAFFESSELFSKLHGEGKLKILSIYPDADLDAWRSTAYPKMMIDARDAELKITSEGLYDLKAIPTLYLLDKEKNVILKDAPIERVEAALMQLAN